MRLNASSCRVSAVARYAAFFTCTTLDWGAGERGDGAAKDLRDGGGESARVGAEE